MSNPAHILIVDDEETVASSISTALTQRGHNVMRATDAAQALSMLRKTQFAVIAINTTRDSAGGLRLIQDVRLRSTNTQTVAVVHRVQLNIAKHALEAGAYDCVTVPTDESGIIVTVIERAAEKYQLMHDNRLLSDRVKQHADGLNNVTRKLHRLATIDELTGLHNKKHFHEILAMELSRSQRYERKFSVVITGIMDFSAYQAQHGSKASDLLLYSLGKFLHNFIRTSDTLTRYADNEFALLLPETNIDGALALLDRLTARINQHAFPGQETFATGHVIIIAGFATFPEHGATSGALIEHSYETFAPR